MYILAFFKRALRLRDETVVPAVCYATCNNAYLEAQAVGLSPELCGPDSAFPSAYKACSDCVTNYDANNGTNGTNSVDSYVEPKFAKFVDFCSTDGSNTTGTGPSATELALFSSQVSVLSYVASVASAASALGLLNATATIVVTVTPTTFPSFTGTSATQSSIPKETSTPEPSSKASIAGAVAGPILLLLLIAGIWFFIRKRKLQRQQVTGLNTPEKAQLHADSVVKPTYELEGEGEVQNISELPAREPVGNELDARRGGGRDDG